ncbi:MAG: hypothetical protein HONBIEJF_02150 [Fimbriimonadaceae bacterium]|nr:hypothetical protein [Fimbriimonadaceae bacterium]
MTKLSRGTWLIVAVLFLVPIIGGQISTQPMPIEHGFGAWLRGILGGPEIPLSTFAVLVVPLLTLLTVKLWREQVLQMPHVKVVIALNLLLTLGLFSVVVSRFKPVSIEVFLVFMGSILAYTLVPMVLGRRIGPVAALTGLTAGCTITALKGISEYADARAIDPTWRVFADWVNQNALAGMLILGLFAAIGLAATARRPWNIAAGACAGAISITLILSQSKGGILCAAIGLLIFAILTVAWRQPRQAAWAILPLLVGVIFTVALNAQAKPGDKTAVSRLSNPAASQEQSVGFRKLLWLSAMDIANNHPAGVGLGAFRYYSAQPGRIQQTNLAHNTPLQLGAEATWLAPFVLIIALGLWLAEAFRGATKLPRDTNVLRAAVVSGVLAFSGHNLIESSLYYPGLCLSFFLMLGIGLQLAADGSSPESIPRWARRPFAIAVVALAILPLVYFAFAEHLKARIHGDLAFGRPQEALAGIAFARAWLPLDAEAPYLMGSMATENPAELLEDLRTAKDRMPTTRHFRALARGYAAAGQPDAAKLALNGALELDPNNLFALEQLLELHRSLHEDQEALNVARRLVRIEAKPVFKIRAIPELVPTQTFRARLFIAGQSPDPAERIAMLEAALSGFDEYRLKTAPLVIRMAKEQPPIPWAGETLQDVQDVMDRGKQAALDLADIYRSQGRTEDAAKAEARAAEFTSAP